VHFVTKVLVVFATILSVFLSALVISYAVNSDRVASDYTNLQAQLASFQGGQQALALEQATQLSAAKQEAQRAKSDADKAANSMRELETRVLQMLATQRTLQDASDKAQALATQLATTNGTQTALIEGLRKDADDSRTKQVEIAKRNAELEKAIADLRRSYDAAENEKKLVREQLAEAKSQLDALRAGGATLGAAKSNEPFVYTGPTISGKVEEVTKDDATGELLAKISVGANDNIRENMKLAIRRDNEFVGNLVVLKTDLKYAIGKIDLLGRSVTVQVGDVVQSNLQ
jgi:outer membrane murein-binding lipoprotein Lpp